MSATFRRATPADSPAIAALLLGDAVRRERANANLWALPQDASARIAASLATIAEPVTGPVRHHWLVAEAGGAAIAVVHAANLPAPPIFDLHGGTAGLISDDSHWPADQATAKAMMLAVEQALREAGAILFIATMPLDGAERREVLESARYAVTTLYMAKTGLAAGPAEPAVRRAAPSDVDGIVALSALHRARLAAASPVFWNPHPQADARFGAWMRTSLDLPDRAMFVSGPSTAIDGFIIAQPGSPMHLAPAHDAARIGLIDDFHALAFEPGSAADPAPARALLAAAEGVFRDKGLDTALAICPAAMDAKADFLARAGYRIATLWAVKADRAG
jgi:hypothetical protein